MSDATPAYVYAVEVAAQAATSAMFAAPGRGALAAAYAYYADTYAALAVAAATEMEKA